MYTHTHTHTRYTYQLLHLFTSAAAASAFAFSLCILLPISFHFNFSLSLPCLLYFSLFLLFALKLILLLFVSFCCCLSCRCQMPSPTLSLSSPAVASRIRRVVQGEQFCFSLALWFLSSFDCVCYVSCGMFCSSQDTMSLFHFVVTIEIVVRCLVVVLLPACFCCCSYCMLFGFGLLSLCILLKNLIDYLALYYTKNKLLFV